MQIRSAGLLLALMLLVTGCAEPPNPDALLKDLAEIKAAMAEVVAGLEASDLARVDKVMHSGQLTPLMNTFQYTVTNAGLPTTSQQELFEAKEKLIAELRVIHGPIHGSGSIDDIDVPAATANINAAVASMQGALPDDWRLPEVASADDDHSEAEQEGHEGHDHDHDQDGHDHDGHDHNGESHEDGTDEEHAGHDHE
ncbi:MAG: hypothetical protein AAGF31_09315 [Planctomycetota bacterium]